MSTKASVRVRVRVQKPDVAAACLTFPSSGKRTREYRRSFVTTGTGEKAVRRKGDRGGKSGLISSLLQSFITALDTFPILERYIHCRCFLAPVVLEVLQSMVLLSHSFRLLGGHHPKDMGGRRDIDYRGQRRECGPRDGRERASGERQGHSQYLWGSGFVFRLTTGSAS